MRLLFSIFSIVYIAGIFLFADSSIVSDLSAFNPDSLLHIPLYGILTVLLIFSFVPFKIKSVSKINLTNLSREMRKQFQRDPINQRHSSNLGNPKVLFLISGGIAFIVAMADEIHQAYIPGRNASITDVLLDLVGIILVLFFASRLYKTRASLIR